MPFVVVASSIVVVAAAARRAVAVAAAAGVAGLAFHAATFAAGDAPAAQAVADVEYIVAAVAIEQSALDSAESCPQ